ncbi:MAG: hypothetical protein D6683_14355 [Actinomyces sp.]|nr:MAG: hypothetical protein D6683_14355 [Actinomyces sp.]
MTTTAGAVEALVVGVGATGARVARHLLADDRVAGVEVRDGDPERAQRIARSLGDGARVGGGRRIDDEVGLVVAAGPAGSQLAVAREAIHAGRPVVTTSDDLDEARRLLLLDQEARYTGVPLVVGAGFMPGFTCLLARHGAREFDTVEEIHVAKLGTGGPACARRHHRALRSTALDWRDGRWVRRPGGSGRELVWFPEPVGGRDCYRAELPDAALLVPEFPGVDRVTARLAATRRDRLTSPLPMLWRPHPEGGVGAVRVELRGRIGGEEAVRIYGAVARPAVAAGAVAAAAAVAALAGELAEGAHGLAAAPEPGRLLRRLAARGLRPSRFVGIVD